MQNKEFKKNIESNLTKEVFIDTQSINGKLIDNLIRIRNEKNISQKELAKICNLQQSNISRIENKKSNIPLDEINKIFNKLGYKIKIDIERI